MKQTHKRLMQFCKVCCSVRWRIRPITEFTLSHHVQTLMSEIAPPTPTLTTSGGSLGSSVHLSSLTNQRPGGGSSLTWMVGGERCLRVVVVDSVVVVSMKVVDISGGTEVVVRAAPLLVGTSPTSLTLPFTLMLTWPSAAMLSTLRPL